MSVAGILPSQLAAEMLRSGVTVRLRAEGGSMRPWLCSGRVVTVEPIADPEELGLGDVVLTLAGGRPMLHRVVQVSPQLVTKGDALGYFDPPPQAILGRAVGLGSLPIARVSSLVQPVQRIVLALGRLLRSAYAKPPA